MKQPYAPPALSFPWITQVVSCSASASVIVRDRRGLVRLMMTPGIESLRIHCGTGVGEDLGSVARRSDAVLGPILQVADGLNLEMLDRYLDYRFGRFEAVALFGKADRQQVTSLLEKVEQKMAWSRVRR